MKNTKIYFFSLAIMALAMTACSDAMKEREQEVTDFAGKIVKYAQDNTIDSIVPLYPGLENQKVTLESLSDSVKVETLDEEGTMFRVKMGNVTMKVERDNNGKMSIVESRGLFTFDPQAIEEARKTGQWVDSLPDLQKVQRMNDEDFLTYFIELKNKATNTGVSPKAGKFVLTHAATCSGCDDSYTLGYVTVTNPNDFPISGSDYRLEYYHGSEENEYTHLEIVSKKSQPGKDIPAHGSVRHNLKYDFEYEGGYAFGFKVVYFPKIKEYVPTGKEYDQYLESKKKK